MGAQQLVSLQLLSWKSSEQFSSSVLFSRAKMIYWLSLWKRKGRVGEENSNPTDSETALLFKKPDSSFYFEIHIYIHWLQIKIMYSFSSYSFFWEKTELYGQLHGFYISSKFWSTIKSTSLWQLLMNMLGKKLGLVTSITSHAGGIWTNIHLTNKTAEFIKKLQAVNLESSL